MTIRSLLLLCSLFAETISCEASSLADEEPRELQGIERFSANIPALSFTSMNGIETQPGNDYVGWLDPEDWVAYEVQIPRAGTYRLDFRVASPFGEGAFELLDFDTQDLYNTVDNFPVTGLWNTWTQLSRSATLPAGLITLEFRILEGGWNLRYFTILELNTVPETLPVDPPVESPISQPVEPPASTPVTQPVSSPITAPSPVSSPITAPSPVAGPPTPPFSTMIPAMAYTDQDGTSRQPSTEGINNVGFIDRGDWMTYTLVLPYDGVYTFEARVSSPDGEGAFQLLEYSTNTRYLIVSSLPVTGGWQSWATISNAVHLTAGRHTLQIRALNQGWNLLWMAFKLLELDPTFAPVPSPTKVPTEAPSTYPSSLFPSFNPTTWPPTASPTEHPTEPPTPNPTSFPTRIPTFQPTSTPTQKPSKWIFPQPSRSPVPPRPINPNPAALPVNEPGRSVATRPSIFM